MSDNNLLTVIDGTEAKAADVNQFKTALVGNLVPRDSNGIPLNLGGDVGESSKKFNNGHIQTMNSTTTNTTTVNATTVGATTGNITTVNSTTVNASRVNAVGHFAAGMIIDHHTYNGAAPIPSGWFPCNGNIINQTNYDAVHGAGAWAANIVTSPLNGKYSPNLVSKYTVGAASTTADGSGAIPSVGNSGHSVATGNHVHQIYEYTGADDNTYNSSGVAVTIPVMGSKAFKRILADDNTVGGPGLGTCYTKAGGSHSTDVQPESIQTIKIIRII